MKHFTHFKSSILRGLLSLFFLTAMVSSAWGEETKTEGFETATAGTNYQSTVTISEAKSDCGIAWKIFYGNVTTSSKISENNSLGLRLYTSDNYGYAHNTTAIEGLNKVSLKAKSSTANSAKIKVNIYYSSNGNTWTLIEENKEINTTATDYSWDIPNGGKFFKIEISSNSTKPSKSNAQLTIDDITFTYTPTGATALSAPTNLSSSDVTSTTATLSWGAVANASSYTLKIGETEHKNVTSTSYSATELTAGTLYTWTVKAVGDGTNYSSSDYAPNAIFTTKAAVTHTVTWSVNGQTTTEKIAEGSAITFNAPTSGIPDGKVFMGWYGSTYSNATTAPEYVKSATMGTEDVTYYAVFATASTEYLDSKSITSYQDGTYYIVDTYVLNEETKYYAFAYPFDETKGTLSCLDITNAVSVESDGTIRITEDKISNPEYKEIKFDIAHSESKYSIAAHGTKDFIRLKRGGNNLTISGGYDWTDFVSYEENGNASNLRFSITGAGTNSSDKATQNCMLLQYSSFDSRIKNQNPTLIVKGYAQSNRGKIAESAQCYATGYMYFVNANSSATTYSEYTTSPTNTLTLAAQSGSDYYATFSNAKAVEFTDAVVYSVELDGSTLSFNEVESKQVPANTGVLIKSATTTAAYHFIESASALEGSNLLKPASEEMTGSYKFYRLAYDNYEAKEGLGFYWGAAEGGTFTCKAGGAYLAVPTSAGASEIRGFSFDDLENGNETAIPEIDPTGEVSLIIYTMTGIRIPKVVEDGLYIVNGKTKWMLAE